MQEIWFPSSDSGSNVVGRVDETRAVDHAASVEQGTTVWKMVPVLLSRIAGNSIEVSSQAIKPHNKKTLCDRFPGAWEHYEKEQLRIEERQSIIPASVAMCGTPLDKQDFIPRDKISFLVTLGFTTVEQIANMDDSVAGNISNAKKWRKQAQEFLKRT